MENQQIFASLLLGFVIMGIMVFFFNTNTRKPVKASSKTRGKIVLKEILVYPIKSCQGISLKEGVLDKFGIKYDRAWMLAKWDDENKLWKFISQRTHGQMALIQTSFQDKFLVVKTPNQSPFKIPLERDEKELKVVTSQVWASVNESLDEGDEAAAYFSKYIGEEVRLIRRRESHGRLVPQEWSKNQTSKVSFADGFPFLLASEESLKQMTDWVGAPVSMKRFRPNLVVEGLEKPFDEDKWKNITIGSIKFEVPKLCTRCKIPTLDPETGLVANEKVSEVLAKYRQGLLKGGAEVCFAQNMVHENLGTLRVGDELKVLS